MKDTQVRVPIKTKTDKLEIKRSVFISTAFPVENESEVKGTIEKVRAQHPKCNHVVYAYSLRQGGGRVFGMSDDGEPKGTAGKPALNVLRHSGLTNVLVTIVRYFGGVKLGKGGLVKAYTESVKRVLENLPSKNATVDVKMQLDFGYEQYEIVRKTFQDFRVREEDRRFEDRVRLIIAVDENLTGSLKKKLLSITKGRIEIEILN
jgi:uncharacterized YigZ family protein